MVDENTFFREVTLRLCGHLKLEDGLHACFRYLARHLPARAIYLETYEHDIHAMRVVARADATGGKRMDVLVPFSDEAKAAMVELAGVYATGELPPVLVINRPNDEPVTMRMLNSLGEPVCSVLSLPLIVEGEPRGALALIAEGSDRFSEDHVRLYATLKEPFFIAMSNVLEHEEVLRLRDRLADDNRYLNRELQRLAGDEIVGADFGLREAMRQVRQVAPTESPVLLTGETGVGKDVIANAIHLASPRRDGPFIPVNCGAIPDSLLDSELFGHEKGAFTGALARKRGRFERADGGTILLDEIGEMPPEAQVRLLRVLQHREIERVGGSERIPVDIRIIAATNRDLEAMVAAGRFREDLWFRLNVFPIRVPPLRERLSDIPALVQHFIERKAAELKLAGSPRLAPGAIDQLMTYSWPGNVRELENLIERAMILHRSEPLRFDDLAAPGRAKPAPAAPSPDDDVLDLDAATARHIRGVLEITGGKIHGPGGAGELLGVNPNTLRSKMRRLGIPFRVHRVGKDRH
ncbi:MAG: sigma 54-interacting transcriptional regulator [Holophagae bacterium]|jgi:transcriptional regulator with GAF, ATPase, and Fis domain